MPRRNSRNDASSSEPLLERLQRALIFPLAESFDQRLDVFELVLGHVAVRHHNHLHEADQRRPFVLIQVGKFHGGEVPRDARRGQRSRTRGNYGNPTWYGGALPVYGSGLGRVTTIVMKIVDAKMLPAITQNPHRLYRGTGGSRASRGATTKAGVPRTSRGAFASIGD